MPGQPAFEVRRVYDEEPSAGFRVLVDRLWPRGVSKETAAIDEWAKDVAPSDGLRRWYGHEPDKFPDFTRRYRAELATAPAKDAVCRLRATAQTSPVILVTATRDVERSGAAVLLDVLLRRGTPPH
ncbi:MAG TPA: DUF488 family protein [Acidimicrobiales bacterium]|jgi:uncharacterized protein YeaO (DUF488 family)|nr:DUF488 family protein [Acidimicrobiales bacterium]